MRKSSSSRAMRRRLEVEMHPASAEMRSSRSSAEILTSAQALRSRVSRTSRATPLGPLKTKQEIPKAPPPHLTGSNRAAQKQCADKNLGTKFRQRGNSLYLAFLIGRAKSTPSYAFLRLLQTSSAPYLAASIASSVRHQHGRDLHSPGGVHAFLRVQHWGRRMLFIRFVNRAVQAVRRSHPRRAAAGKR